MGIGSGAWGQTPAPALALQPADREAFAGISYRDLITGSLILTGTTVAAAALTGSMVASAAAALAVAGAFIVFEPGNSRFLSKVDVPTLPEMRRTPDRD